MARAGTPKRRKAPGRLPRSEFEAKKLILRLDTVIDGRPEAVAPAVEGMMQVVRTMGCAAGREHDIETALQEALANAVIHGCKKDPGKKVACSVACDASRRMLIVIRDPGDGFDPASIPNPVLGQQIYSTHGRGIFIINQLMDKVWFERGGTEIHMLKG
jgi:serine/threonine-protein kinase RsbW